MKRDTYLFSLSAQFMSTSVLNIIATLHLDYRAAIQFIV